MNGTAEVQSLGKPQEFDEAMASAQSQVLGPAPTTRRGRRNAPAAAAEGDEEQDRSGVIVSPVVPTIPYIVKIGSQERTVHVVDKRQMFTIPREQLRARWQDVAKRPNGKVCVYDADGKLLARFENWSMAVTEFRKSNMLEAVEDYLAKQKARREKAEAAAREERERNRKAA